MRHVKTFRTAEELVEAIDTGGRWYDVFTRAGDRVVSRRELDAAAGSGGDALLYLEMVTWDLHPLEQERVVELLEPRLASAFRERDTLAIGTAPPPQELETGRRVIIEGVIERLGHREHLEGFIPMPFRPGSTPPGLEMPEDRECAIWRLDSPVTLPALGAPPPEPQVLLAVPPGCDLPDVGRVRAGGIVRRLIAHRDASAPGRHLLHAAYCTAVDGTT